MLPDCMEAAHDDLDAGVEELFSDVDRAGKLISLHANEADHCAVRSLQAADQFVETHDRIGLVDHLDFDVDILSKNVPAPALVHQAVDHGQRIGRYGGTCPLDDITVIIIMGRLDQNNQKPPGP